MGELIQFRKPTGRVLVKKQESPAPNCQACHYKVQFLRLCDAFDGIPSSQEQSVQSEPSKEMTPSDICDQKNGAFKCPCCEFYTENLLGFFKHFDRMNDDKHHTWHMTHWNELYRIEQNAREKYRQECKFKCEQCGRKFHDLDKLSKHISRIHDAEKLEN